MQAPAFTHLNIDWNAEPNAPEPEVSTTGAVLRLTFYLNPYAYAAREDERGCLTFSDCRMWRLGSPNDEGWFRGQCRYSAFAPQWGEFYALTGNDTLPGPIDWHALPGQGVHHFLFYFRDNTFECLAAQWHLSRSG